MKARRSLMISALQAQATLAVIERAEYARLRRGDTEPLILRHWLYCAFEAAKKGAR